MDKILQNVGELSSPARSVVEGLMGHPLRDDQQLYIVALDAAVEPTAPERNEAWKDLEEIIAEAQQNVRDSGISPEDLERTIDQACDEVRYGK